MSTTRRTHYYLKFWLERLLIGFIATCLAFVTQWYTVQLYKVLGVPAVVLSVLFTGFMLSVRWGK